MNQQPNTQARKKAIEAYGKSGQEPIVQPQQKPDDSLDYDEEDKKPLYGCLFVLGVGFVFGVGAYQIVQWVAQ